KISHSLSLISLGYNLPSYFLLTSSYSFLYSLSRQVLSAGIGKIPGVISPSSLIDVEEINVTVCSSFTGPGIFTPKLITMLH
ncbi:MAG: hypothetical protein O7162_04235, partial [Wolbachia endosymbiont of Andrena minutula]|nr:hypothetical protein [Wolbachia endosymbiont of Andrena minutula]